MVNLAKIIRKEKGQALVEMALVLPLLLLLLWGIVEFGRLGHAYLATTHAAREGARLGAVGLNDSLISQEIARRTSTLEESRLTVIITPPEQYRFTGEFIEVEIDYSLDFYMPLMGVAFPNPYPVKAISIMRVE